jgi:hypothetical protein
MSAKADEIISQAKAASKEMAVKARSDIREAGLADEATIEGHASKLSKEIVERVLQ